MIVGCLALSNILWRIWKKPNHARVDIHVFEAIWTTWDTVDNYLCITQRDSTLCEVKQHLLQPLLMGNLNWSFDAMHFPQITKRNISVSHFSGARYNPKVFSLKMTEMPQEVFRLPERCWTTLISITRFVPKRGWRTYPGVMLAREGWRRCLASTRTRDRPALPHSFCHPHPSHSDKGQKSSSVE